MENSLLYRVFSKFNVKSGLILVSVLLFISGISMCYSGLESSGTIDIKTSYIEGKLDTGSLGLIVIFLGVFVTLAAMAISLQSKKIKIIHGDLTVEAANMEEQEWKHIVSCVGLHEDKHTERERINSGQLDNAKIVDDNLT